MSILIGFTITTMFCLFIYVVIELIIKKRLYMVLSLWLEIFALTIGISAFVQDVKTSDIAELIYIFCGIVPPIAILILENREKIYDLIENIGIKALFTNIIEAVNKRFYKKLLNSDHESMDIKPIDSISTDNPEGYLKLGREYEVAGFYNEAAECFKRYVEIKKDGYEGYMELGASYESLGRTDDAMRAYRKSISCNPNNIEGYIYLGSCYLSLLRYNEAIELYISAIKQNPEEYILYFHLGIVCEQCKKYPEAAKAYEMALEINPSDEETTYHLGAVLTELRKYEEAIYTYKSALKVKPSDYELFYNLSIVYSLLKKPEIAIDNLKRAIDLNTSLKFNILYNKAFDNLRSLPEFKRVIG